MHHALLRIYAEVHLQPKYHWLPFLVWCISGSRSPLAFLVDEGAWISHPRSCPSRSDTLHLQINIPCFQHQPAHTVLFQQMTEAQHGCLIRRRSYAKAHAANRRSDEDS
jgi:hypothetical protein